VSIFGLTCAAYPLYASAQPLDFLARTKHASFPNRKLLEPLRSFRMDTSYNVAI